MIFVVGGWPKKEGLVASKRSDYGVKSHGKTTYKKLWWPVSNPTKGLLRLTGKGNGVAL
jgi:hypothetical protein